MSDQSIQCKKDQCVSVKVCQHCGVRVGQNHHYWCRFYPQRDTDWNITTDMEDYEVHLSEYGALK